MRFDIGLIVALFVLVSAPAVLVLAVGLLRGRLSPLGGVIGVVILPGLAFVFSNLALMERSKSVDFCGSCHEMAPVLETVVGEGDSLAAIHYRAAFPSKEACYVCHSGYGIWGEVQAKGAGVKHMWASLTGSVHYPLAIYEPFDYGSCLGCHAESRDFRAAAVHDDPEIQSMLLSGELRCAGACHPVAHPPEALQAPASLASAATEGRP